jgi:hypothetical protein
VFFESKNDARTIAAQWCIGNGLNPDLEFEHPENVYVGKEVERLLNTGVEYSGDWNELLMPEPTFALILDGRHPQEKCVVYIEKQTVKGYAYMELNTQIRNKSLVKKLISPFPKDPYIFSLTVKFIQEKKFTDIVTF